MITQKINWRLYDRQLGEEKPEEELMGKVFLFINIMPGNKKIMRQF